MLFGRELLSFLCLGETLSNGSDVILGPDEIMGVSSEMRLIRDHSTHMSHHMSLGLKCVISCESAGMQPICQCAEDATLPELQFVFHADLASVED